MNVFWLRHLGKPPKTRAHPSAGTCRETLWRSRLEQLASGMELCPQKGSDRRPFHFSLHSFSISHPVSFNLQNEGEPGSNRMRKHKATQTHGAPLLPEVVAEIKRSVLKSDTPWETHFPFWSISFLNCLLGVTTYFSQLGGSEVWRGQRRLGTQREPKFVLIL